MQLDWLTVAAQIVNFLVLVWLLRRFLYRPITDAMARREARIEARLAEAKDTRARVEAEAEQVRQTREELDASREEMLREARREAHELRRRMEDDLREEMEARRKTWEGHLREERDEFARSLQQRAGHQVVDIVGRILKDYAGSDLEGRVSSTFVDRLATLDAEALEKLRAAAGRAEGPVRIESSVPVTPASRSQITRAVRAHIAPDIEVEFGEYDDLLLGLRLTIGQQTVEWSASRFLGRLETTLDGVIEGRGRQRAARTAESAGSG